MIKTINLYTLQDYPTLPYNGWFKICSFKNCEQITSKFIIYKKYKFYFCKQCINNDCVNYIENKLKYFYPYC
jgi:hypothetical protein